MAARSSVKLSPLSVQPGDLSDSINFHSARRPSDNFCQLSVWSGELSSASKKFRTDRRPKSTCFNFSCGQETHHTARISSVNFYQTSMQPDDQLPNFRAAEIFFVNSPYVVRSSVNFRQFSMQWEISSQLPSTSVWPEGLLSIFYGAERPSANLRQHSMLQGDFPSASVKIPCCWVNFRQFSSNFLAAGRLYVSFVNFPCGRESFCQLRQLSVPSGEILSSSINFLNGRETFRQLPSPFCAARRPAVINGRSPGCMKVDRSCWKVSCGKEIRQKSTEVLPTIGKVDGSTQKVFTPQGMLTEVDGRSPDHKNVEGKSSGHTEN